MNKLTRQLFAFALVFFLVALRFSLSGATAADTSSPPNIILIISDDHGWQDYGFMGHPHIKTPNLDKLADQSLLFPRGYVPTALCSPSLASLITGRYPHEHLINYNDPPAPPGGKVGKWREHPQYLAAWDQMRGFIQRQPQLPKLLQARGYLSLQTGKWWLGNYANGGFTHGMSHGDKGRGGRHGDEGLDIGRKTMQPIFDFVSEAKQKQKPFMVWYAPMLPHNPHTAPQRLVDKYTSIASSREHASYWASVEWFDESCGQLLDYLDQQKLSDNTIVIYVTDNGWTQSDQGDAVSIRSKRTPYDAGIRTPIMLRWPGKVKAERSMAVATSLDIVPTLLAAAVISSNEKWRGINWLDRAALQKRRALFGATFTHDAISLTDPAANVLSRWIIDGNWKLILPVTGRKGEDVPDEPLLYRITSDEQELTSLAQQEPARVAELRRKLNGWWKP